MGDRYTQRLIDEMNKVRTEALRNATLPQYNLLPQDVYSDVVETIKGDQRGLIGFPRSGKYKDYPIDISPMTERDPEDLAIIQNAYKELMAPYMKVYEEYTKALPNLIVANEEANTAKLIREEKLKERGNRVGSGVGTAAAAAPAPPPPTTVPATGAWNTYGIPGLRAPKRATPSQTVPGVLDTNKKTMYDQRSFLDKYGKYRYKKENE